MSFSPCSKYNITWFFPRDRITASIGTLFSINNANASSISRYRCSQYRVSAWLGKHLGYNGESECEDLWMSYGSLLPKTSHQVWSGPSWCCVCPSSLLPFTPTQTHFTLWCLCAFVNEEILVPGWDIAVSWATSSSLSRLFTPGQLTTTPTNRDGAFWKKTLQLHHEVDGNASLKITDEKS